SANPQRIERYPQRSSQFLPAHFIRGFFSLMISGNEMEALRRNLLQAPIEVYLFITDCGKLRGSDDRGSAGMFF
ncbi:MAG: hypothetical protein L0220_18435, partial [Acidobacteria bacterium]|nr:hypothetical protein [Acidobacteriota bacterium]